MTDEYSKGRLFRSYFSKKNGFRLGSDLFSHPEQKTNIYGDQHCPPNPLGGSRRRRFQPAKFTRNLERCHGEHGAGSKAHEVILSSSRPLIDVSRQRASEILLKKWYTRFGHQLSPMPQMACLTFTTPCALFRAHCGSYAP